MTQSTCILGLKILFFLFGPFLAHAQSLSLEEYMGYVKEFHPYVKQANIDLNESEAKLLKARGAFDPAVTAEYKEKVVKESPYYEQFNATFTLPTSLGIELKAEVNEAEGNLLNPENYVNGDQLYAVGADLDLGKGLLANERMIILKQARRYVQQAEEENRLAVNKILEVAGHAFLDWYSAYLQWEIIGQFVENAAFRFKGVKKRVAAGDLAPIDSIEARIAFNNRKMMWEKSRIKLMTKALKASTFLWLEEQPLEIQADVIPTMDNTSMLPYTTTKEPLIKNHPKLKALTYKIEQGELEQRLQRNNFLPEIKLGYRWLSSTNPLQNLQKGLDAGNNITRLKVKMPLFFRKERANLKLSTLRLNDLRLEQEQIQLELTNKITALEAQQRSFTKQKNLAQNMTDDYKTLYTGEQKKFDAGESSLFLVNSREAKWLDATQKFIRLQQAQQKLKMSYYFSFNF